MKAEDIEALRARKNQEFDGEAHLTNEELDALLDAASRLEQAEQSTLQMAHSREVAVGELEAAKERLAEVEQSLAKTAARLRWYRAAHMLVADEFAWVGHREKGDVRLAFLCNDENWDPILYVMCSDTFAWACADAEKAEYTDAEKLLEIAVKDGWYGLIRWVQAERERRGEIEEPIGPVKKRFAAYDTAKERAEAAEEKLAELEREDERLRARLAQIYEKIGQADAHLGRAIEEIENS